jgi:predicted transposase/invertase (TIGR01784 family)
MFLRGGMCMTKEKVIADTEVSRTDFINEISDIEEIEVNLSDFALFLTVMKDKRAYRNTLSIIMDEEDIQLKEVKVEQVVLNESGKRAIRLDAWALSDDNRQFDMEMQNDSEHDSLPKRSRYYQGLMDSPILKSGKKTKYKRLPSTTIIFITRDDVFKKDLAKYTFTEQCEEVEGLKLEDGTTKIFLNMTSKNGSPELISLLQYMKHTDINNPDITKKDKRLVELDEVVREVKESEEWEAVKVDLIDIGIQRGITQGISQGISQGIDRGELKKIILLISKKKTKNCTVEETADMLETDCELVQKVYDALEKYDAATQWEEIIKQIN